MKYKLNIIVSSKITLVHLEIINLISMTESVLCIIAFPIIGNTSLVQWSQVRSNRSVYRKRKASPRASRELLYQYLLGQEKHSGHQLDCHEN